MVAADAAKVLGVRRSRERLGRCSGRREKHLPWRGQAAAEASAPVNVHAVLLSDNGDNGLCPREDAGNHGLVQRAEEVQKRSFCRRSFPHFFRCWKKWGRRRQMKRSRRGAKLSPSETKKRSRLGAATPHPSRLRRATCLPAGRSVRGSDTPPACHSTLRTPQEEGLRGASFSTTDPSRGRLEGQREMVWPWPFFRAASSRAAAVEMSCKAIPVESKMVISSPPVRPGAAPEMTPPMSQRVPSKMPFL